MLQFRTIAESRNARTVVCVATVALSSGWSSGGGRTDESVNDARPRIQDMPGTDGQSPARRRDDTAPPGVVNFTRVDATVACAGAIGLRSETLRTFAIDYVGTPGA